MKGLLLKDFYVLWKQARVLLLLMLAFTVLPGMSAFVILYAAMLPYTALAYDEQAKWDTLAAM
ncbi:MAG: ABC-2 transporter permease, partial [Ruthenibacterium sp.]